jgi:hypothetical protein
VESLRGWIESNWFNLAQTAGIICGLVFTGLALRREARARHFSNLLSLKSEHRELWSLVHERPELARVLQSDVDLVAFPINNEEEIFLRQMIVHFAVAFELNKAGTPFDLQGFSKDAAEIFSLPLPRLAFERAKNAQDPAFNSFVEEAMRRYGFRGETTTR